MSRWYRAYAGTVKDDKLAEVSVIAGCSRSVSIAVWHAILESAAETEDGGRFETTPRRVAAALCEPASIIEAAFMAMEEIGMIGEGSVTAWRSRQYESDNSTERSRKHRETKRNADATLQGRCATPPEAETETEAYTPTVSNEPVGGRAKAPPEHVQILDCLKTVLSEERAKAVVDHRRKKKAALSLHAARLLVGQFSQIAEPNKAADLMIMRGWQGCEPDWCVNAGLKLAETSPQGGTSPSQIFIVMHTPEWDAWQAATPQKLKPIETQRHGLGRYFPSRLPPTEQERAVA